MEKKKIVDFDDLQGLLLHSVGLGYNTESSLCQNK